jgi:hypothetical protein
VEISEATPMPVTKWPLWTWFAYPALAIAIGGGLGYVVADLRQAPEIHATTTPVVAAPQPSASPDVAAPSPEIEVDPEPVKAASTALAPRVTPKPKGKPKPTKSTRCDVYDHMNGC